MRSSNKSDRIKDQMKKRPLLFCVGSVVLRRRRTLRRSPWLSLLPENELTRIIHVALSSFNNPFHDIKCTLVIVCSSIGYGKLLPQVVDDELLTRVGSTLSIFLLLCLLDLLLGSPLLSVAL